MMKRTRLPVTAFVEGSGRLLLLIAGAMLLSNAPLYAQDTGGAPQQNIVFILADDLGYMDVAAYAARTRGVAPHETYYETPNIDRLVAEGVAFSQAYVHQLCSPTRVALLTGRNAAEIGFTTAAPANVRTYYNTGVRPPPGYHPQDAIYHSDPTDLPQALRNGSTLTALPSGGPDDAGRDAVTFAEAMPGYRSAFLGKWHIGGHGAEGYQPSDQGFEAPAYYDGGASLYFDWRERWNAEKLRFPEMPQDRSYSGDAGSASDAAYLTDALTQEAVHFLTERAERQDGPFLLYVSHFAVHGPLQAPDEDVAHFRAKSERGWNGQRHPTYAAMLRKLDQSVGAIIETLEETELDENTMIVFMSDNGGVDFQLGGEEIPSTSNAPFKGGKATVYEGGIRVPLVFWRKNGIDGGRWVDTPVHATDMFPTFLELGGYEPADHAGAGQSLVPFVDRPAAAEKRYSRDTFYWHYPFNVKVSHPEDDLPLTPHSAIRSGDYKLIVDWHGRVQLYDIAADPYERSDLADREPARVEALFGKLTRWMDEHIEPRYVARPNPSYDARTDPRPLPYRNLREFPPQSGGD